MQSASPVASLKACTKNKDLHAGTSVHADILQRGLIGKCPFVDSALVTMYAKCGALEKAKEVFEGLPSRDVASWNALITGYVQNEHGNKALKCFACMQHEGILPDPVTFICTLKACGSIGALNRGKSFHFEVFKQGFLGEHIALGNAFVDMYAKCGALAEAREMLDWLPVRDVVSWSALIAGYTNMEHSEAALDCLDEMQSEGLFPNTVTFICALKACGSSGALDNGEKIHAEIVRQRLLGGSIVLGGALVYMYVKCGMLTKAHEVLDMLPVRDVVLWSALITRYVQEEHCKEALNCYEQMQHEGLFPDAVTFACILKACGSLGAIDKGQEMHAEIGRQGLMGRSVILGNAFVDMYTKCGALAKAQEVLEGLTVRDAVSWNALITGYVQGEHDRKALKCFDQMQCEGIFPTAVTFINILKACGSVKAFKLGEHIHSEIDRQGLLCRNIALEGALVDMYAKCGMLARAEKVLEGLPLQNAIMWNALIAGYVQGDYGKEALDCFDQMQYEGFSPDAVTCTCILKACGSMGALERGENIHFEIVKQRWLAGHIVLGNALVDMYGKCGAVEKAREVLEELYIRDVVSWNSLITVYAQGEHAKAALNCFEWMHCDGCSPDTLTLACILKACSSLGALDKGIDIHAEIVKQGLLVRSVVLGNALVDMYAKCGAVVKAKEVFDGLPCRDVASWNALISGYAQGELGKEAFNCFGQMQQEGLLPDEISFLCLLRICNHSGFLNEGREYFSKMSRDYGIVASSEHHIRMVNLFGHLGSLDKAVVATIKMLLYDDLSLWLSLLSACKTWGNAMLGRWAYDNAVKTERKAHVYRV